MAMPQAAPKKQPEPAAPRRSFLSGVTKGKIKSPDRVLLAGTEGVGKSTWGAQAPNPVFVNADDGTNQIDVARLPALEKWTDLLDAIDELRTGKHDFKTFVADTLDALEPLLWKFICARDGHASIEDYGYGKGYTAALDEWRNFLSALERLRSERGMEIILLAHTQIKPFKNPEGEDYDRFELKLHAKAGGLIKEWCDSVLFARYEQYVNKDAKTKRARGVSTGARIVHTQRHAAYDAKTRYALPETLPLDYAEYAAARAGVHPTQAAELVITIAAQLDQLRDNEKRAQVATFVANNNGDAVKLAQASNRLAALIAEQAPIETTNTEENANV